MSEGLAFKSFVSETEIEEKRQKRQEEWDKVRTADQPEECPEEEYDNRSLYDRLQEQKDKKQAEYDEQHQFRNMVRGLDDDESKFLGEVAQRQMDIENQKKQEERDILKEVEEYKDRVSSIEEQAGNTKTPQEKRKLIDTAGSKKKSQAALLAGAVKRKRSDAAEESVAKKPNVNTDLIPTSASTTATYSTPAKSPESTNTASGRNGTVQSSDGSKKKPSKAYVAAVLPGLGSYTNSDDSDTSESSDSELDLMGPLVPRPRPKKKVHAH